jgi:hypothetical protein
MPLLLRYTIKCLLLTLALSQSAWAQLSVSPKRVIFEGRERSHQLLLINTGDTTKKYRISFKELKMTTAGGYETIQPKGNEHSLLASKAIRFSPRHVTLKPGMTQTVRLLVRKPKDFIDGEYRSHLTFSEVPDSGDQFGTNNISDNQGFAFRMKPLLGISIPIILRQGKLEQSVQIKQVKLNDTEINLVLDRTGSASVYGAISATFKSTQNLPPLVIGLIKGVSVLTPLRSRNVTIPLTARIKELGPGELQLTFNNLELNSLKKTPVFSTFSLKF